MSTIIQDLYDEITHDLGNLETDKDEYQVIIDNLLIMIHCLSYDVYNNNIDMVFLNKVEVIKQYRQTVRNSENVNFLKSVIQKLQKLKIMTLAAVYEKYPEIWCV